MPRLEERDYTYFSTVRGMCRSCRKTVPARVMFCGDEVWQQSLCADCENAPAKIADSKEWYLNHALRSVRDQSPLKHAYAPSNGCPRDCGPCSWHASPCQLPVVSITNVCNMNCPICFTYNRPDQQYFMSVDEMRKTVDWIVESSGKVDLINITGAEPTMHPQLFDLLACCKRPEIGRITMNSNGLRLASDKDLCRRLADLGVYVVLSCHAFDPETSMLIHGCDVVEQKLQVIKNLTEAGVRMTLLNALVRDVNEGAIGRILELMRENDHVLSLTVQTMTYTGQGGGKMERATHIPVDEAARIVCEQSGGALEFGDFHDRPSAHPLCYLVSYMIKAGDDFLPFARFASIDKLREMMSDSYLLHFDDERGFFTDVINQLYAEGNTEQLKLFKRMIRDLYPDEPLDCFVRQQKAESAVRTVYIHAHMDEDTFDCSRAMMCPDLVPVEPGRMIPACTYNLFYRMQDERFYVEAKS